MMKILRSLVLALVLGASATVAQARDSFHIGISLGGYGFYPAPVAVYPVVPQVIYYDAPRVYQPLPYAYYPAPVVRYYDGVPRHHFSGHRHHGGHGHPGRGHYR